MDRVPVVLVTGALGAGKTTLLERAIAGPLAGRRVSFVINELAAQGLDGALLASRGAEVYEAAGGCLCCDLAGDVVTLIDGFVAERRPELLVVESSGATDAAQFVRALAGKRTRLARIVTVVDLASGARMLAASEAARRQVAVADVLALTKGDRATAEERDATMRGVRAIHPAARAEDVAAVGTASLFEPAHDREIVPLLGGPPHLALDGIEAVTFDVPWALERGKFEAWARDLPPSVWRAKGNLLFAGEGARVFQHVHGRFELTPSPLGPEAPFGVAVIGPGVGRIRVGLLRALDLAAA